MSVWINVTAANNGTAITDAAFSASYAETPATIGPGYSGWYWVDVGYNDDFYCSAPNYDTCYTTAWSSAGYWDPSRLQTVFNVKLTYTGGWPQTY
jgi:hypothetical protein